MVFSVWGKLVSKIFHLVKLCNEQEEVDFSQDYGEDLQQVVRFVVIRFGRSFHPFLYLFYHLHDIMA